MSNELVSNGLLSAGGVFLIWALNLMERRLVLGVEGKSEKEIQVCVSNIVKLVIVTLIAGLVGIVGSIWGGGLSFVTASLAVAVLIATVGFVFDALKLKGFDVGELRKILQMNGFLLAATATGCIGAGIAWYLCGQ